MNPVLTPVPRGGRWWPLLPVVLLSIPVGANSALAYLASHDAGFAPEKDAWRHAVQWDARQAELAQSRALGWHVDVAGRQSGGQTQFDLTVRDAAGLPLTGADVTAEVRRVARSGTLLPAHAVVDAAGQAHWTVAIGSPGLCDTDLRVVLGGKHWSGTLRLDVAPGRP
jgi:hypothetical protein